MATENYLSLNINKYERSIFAKLRSRTLPLYFEKGRYEQKTLENRTCPICKTCEIEDEVHFVINCDGYTLKRTAVFSYVAENINDSFMSMDCDEKFVQLMNLENSSLKKFIKFVVDIWNLRKCILLVK